MADITAAMVKDLRERTGAGMMDCKKALTETNGDMEAAVDWLRTKGLAAAAKKAGRTAAEGLVGVAVAGTTRRRGRSQLGNRFRRQERTVPGLRAQRHRSRRSTLGSDVDALMAAAYPDSDGTVHDKLTDNIATIGENQSLRRAAIVEVDAGRRDVLCPQRRRAGPGQDRRAGRAGSRPRGADVLEPLGKQIAMHIAAANPLALDDDRP